MWEKIWKIKALQRVKTLLCAVQHRCIMTNQERCRRGFTTEAQCKICLGCNEDLDHVFLRAGAKMQNPYGNCFFQMSSEPSLRTSHSKNGCNGTFGKRVGKITRTTAWRNTFAIILWWIWRWRNSYAFDNIAPSLSEKIRVI